MRSGYLNRKRMNRKSFLSALVRGGILGSMALLTGVLFSRKQLTLEKECGLSVQCRNCSKLKNCQLPEAEKERGNEKG